MNKLIRDGQVAVIYSPGYGAGWSTWSAPEEAMFDPTLAEMILAKRPVGEWLEYAKAKWPNLYLGGLEQAQVAWVPVGARFRIEEYDGAESVHTIDDYDYFVA